MHRIYNFSVVSVYQLYIIKVTKKGRTQAEVDEVICWLTGYQPNELAEQLRSEATFAEFFAQAPKLNPDRFLITGKICGIDLTSIEEPLMREIRFMDKLIDELAKGRPMSKILRKPTV